MTQPPDPYTPKAMREQADCAERQVVTWMLHQGADAEEALAALRAVIQQELDNENTPMDSLMAIAEAADMWPQGEQVPSVCQ